MKILTIDLIISLWTCVIIGIAQLIMGVALANFGLVSVISLMIFGAVYLTEIIIIEEMKNDS